MKKSERVEEGAACGRCGTTNRSARSFCRKCGLHLKSKPLARPKAPLPRATAPIPRSRKPIAQMSARRISQRERRAEVIAEVTARDKVCQAGAVHALIPTVRCEGRLEVHELISRGQWAKGYLESDNCVLVCEHAHRWITTHPYGAHALGLTKWSWER